MSDLDKIARQVRGIAAVVLRYDSRLHAELDRIATTLVTLHVSEPGEDLRDVATKLRALTGPSGDNALPERIDAAAAAADNLTREVSRLEDRVRELEDEVEDAPDANDLEEAQEAEAAAEARADDLEQSLSDIVEAAVAAREGRPGAAQAVVDMICRRHPEIGQHLPGLVGAALSRPRDYWTYG